MDKNPWKRLGSTLIHRNPWFSVRRDDVIRPDRVPGSYHVVQAERLAVGILPLWEDQSITLVGQYRYPIERYSWEIPEGGGPPAEDPLKIAMRELREETGLSSESWQHLGYCHLSNCFLDELCHLYLAEDLKQGESQPDGSEVLETRRMPVHEAIGMAIDGRISDAITLAGLFHLLRFLDGKR